MSDHFSGPRAIAGPAGDICDLYAFPSPDRPGHLVLVMTLWPRAGHSTRFSAGITCRFRLRPLTVVTVGSAPSFAVGAEEYVVDATFDSAAPVREAEPAPQRGRVSLTGRDSLDLLFDDEPRAVDGGVRVFAGLRSDPFFIDLPALQQTVRTRQLAFGPPGANSLDGFNVLSLVVEIDGSSLAEAGGGPLFAVVAETLTAGALPIRLERVGRPEIKNVILAWKEFDLLNRNIDLRDLYNLEDPYHLGGDYRPAYRARIDANLAMFDRLDGRVDWPLGPEGGHPLTELLLADYLVVDVSKPYAADSFLEIERAMLQGRPHATCGGRSLNDDVMDTLYSLLVSGDTDRIGDGVDRATVPASLSFPYLAAPNPMPVSLARAVA